MFSLTSLWEVRTAINTQLCMAQLQVEPKPWTKGRGGPASMRLKSLAARICTDSIRYRANYSPRRRRTPSRNTRGTNEPQKDTCYSLMTNLRFSSCIKCKTKTPQGHTYCYKCAGAFCRYPCVSLKPANLGGANSANSMRDMWQAQQEDHQQGSANLGSEILPQVRSPFARRSTMWMRTWQDLGGSACLCGLEAGRIGKAGKRSRNAAVGRASFFFLVLFARPPEGRLPAWCLTVRPYSWS